MGNKFYFRGKLEEDAMYNYLKQRLKHAIRFRHKRGFGVHSPFVFDLITNVIKEKAEYYDFQVVEAQGRIRDKERKLCRMLFRLVDYFSYREIVFLGIENPWVTRYLGAVASDMRLLDGGGNCPDGEFSGKAGGEREKADMLFLGRNLEGVWNAEWDNMLRRNVDGPLCVVVKDIYKRPFNARLWRQMRKECTVSIDMMWYGILFWNKKLQKGKYNMII